MPIYRRSNTVPFEITSSNRLKVKNYFSGLRKFITKMSSKKRNPEILTLEEHMPMEKSRATSTPTCNLRRKKINRSYTYHFNERPVKGANFDTETEQIKLELASKDIGKCSTTKKEFEDLSTDVFLGGSCNPTTWRKDFAMPLLKEANVTFYNPQVEEWTEECVELEAKAKEHSKIVLFVIDNQTRGIVSMNEAAEYICRGRRVVLVVQNFSSSEKVVVDDTELAKDEIEDLNNARDFLCQVAKENGTHVFCDIKSAISSIVTCLNKNKEKIKHIKPEIRLRKQSSLLLQIWNENKPKKRKVKYRSMSSECKENSDIFKQKVFLDGDKNFRNDWRNGIAEPHLKSNNIPYVNGEENPDLNPNDNDLILFVINKNIRSAELMLRAITLITCNFPIILVIEAVKENEQMWDGTILKGREYKDFNRGRVYLEESAKRNQIEVYSEVHLAIGSIIARLK